MEFVNVFKQCRKIIGVGRNYRDHALELNNPVPKRPLLFLKAPSSLLEEGKSIRIPDGCTALHHEVELGVVISEPGSNIPKEKAYDHIAAYAVVLDMTARDFQDAIKEKGHPWLLAKCWDTFCPISKLVPKSNLSNPHDLNLWLKVDGELRQSGNTSDMIFQIPEIINYTSKIMRLEKGDLILTGTPSGVGPVQSGQIISCGIEGINEMSFKVE